MQTRSEIDDLIARAAAPALGDHHIARISSRSGVDSDGLEAVRITIVLSGHDDTLSGDAALNAIVDVHQALQKTGDERFPYIDFTNEHDLASDADPEPDPSA